MKSEPSIRENEYQRTSKFSFRTNLEDRVIIASPSLSNLTSPYYIRMGGTLCHDKSNRRDAVRLDDSSFSSFTPQDIPKEESFPVFRGVPPMTHPRDSPSIRRFNQPPLPRDKRNCLRMLLQRKLVVRIFKFVDVGDVHRKYVSLTC